MINQQKILGLHAVKAALNALDKQQAGNQNQLWVDKARHDARIKQLINLAKQKGVQVKPSSKSQLDSLAASNISDQETLRHQGVVLQLQSADEQLAEVKNEAFLDALLQNLNKIPLLLILDGVQDPHNLGACLRTADAAGVDAVIIPKDRAVSLTPVVRKVACGADQSVPLIQVTNLSRTLKLLKTYNIWVVGTAGESSSSVFKNDLKGGLAVVMGAEGKGMRRLTRENCDLLVNIPMLGQVESLNVSVATGIILFEVVRQQQTDN